MDVSFQKPIDYITYQLSQQFMDLSKNELRMLALIHLKGLSSEIKNTIVKHNIFKSRQSIENHLSKFRRLGIIKDGKVVLKYPISTKNNVKLNITVSVG